MNYIKHDLLITNDAGKTGDLDFAMASAFINNMWSIGETRLFQQAGNLTMRLGVQLQASISGMRHFVMWTEGNSDAVADWVLEASAHWPTVTFTFESGSEIRNGEYL